MGEVIRKKSFCGRYSIVMSKQEWLFRERLIKHNERAIANAGDPWRTKK